MKALTTPSTSKWYLTTASIIFTVIAIAHLVIIIFQTPASVAMYTVPYEINGIVVMVLGYLATRGFMEAHKIK